MKFAKQNASMTINQQESHELTDQARENDYTLPPGSELVTFTNEHSSEVMKVEHICCCCSVATLVHGQNDIITVLY